MRLATTVLLCLGVLALSACSPVVLGRRLGVDPRLTFKVGHHEKADVLRELGEPYRRFTDSQGNEVFTYLWVDGLGGGQKCTVAFNQNNVIYLVEVVP